MLIQKNFIKMVERTPFDPGREKETIALLTKIPDMVNDFPMYHVVDKQIRLRPSLTLTLSNNQTRVIYFDTPEQCERWKRMYRIMPQSAVIPCDNLPKSVSDWFTDLLNRLMFM